MLDDFAQGWRRIGKFQAVQEANDGNNCEYCLDSDEQTIQPQQKGTILVARTTGDMRVEQEYLYYIVNKQARRVKPAITRVEQSRETGGSQEHAQNHDMPAAK